MAERSLDQWWRTTARWALVGAVVGVLVAVGFAVADPRSSWLEMAGVVPLLAAFFVVLRYSVHVYTYDYAKVWGWPSIGLLCVVLASLMGAGIGGLCAAGSCGR